MVWGHLGEAKKKKQAQLGGDRREMESEWNDFIFFHSFTGKKRSGDGDLKGTELGMCVTTP